METTMPTINTATKWVLDPAHSELVFKVKHLMISNVKGEFTRFQVDVKGEDLTKAPIEVTIDAGLITTNDEQRD